MLAAPRYHSRGDLPAATRWLEASGDGKLMRGYCSSEQDRICLIDAMAGNFKLGQWSIESTRQGRAMAQT